MTRERPTRHLPPRLLTSECVLATPLVSLNPLRADKGKGKGKAEDTEEAEAAEPAADVDDEAPGEIIEGKRKRAKVDYSRVSLHPAVHPHADTF